MKMGFPGGPGGKEPTGQSRRRETWVRSLDWEDSLEEGRSAHLSILAWRIPWAEEPGGPQCRVTKTWTWVKQVSTQARKYKDKTQNWLFETICENRRLLEKKYSCSLEWKSGLVFLIKVATNSANIRCSGETFQNCMDLKRHFTFSN